MKITFYSNFMNHHQLPISQEFIKMGIDYTFVATEPIPQERLDLGYEDMNSKYPFVLTTYDDIEKENEAFKLALESDIVIIGSAPDKYVSERLKNNKITFKYSERLFKDSILRFFDPRIYFYIKNNYYKYKDKNYFLLASSAYATADFNSYGAFINKAYKWGYFPEVKKNNINKLLLEKRKKDYLEILWCGRLIECKHPDLAIKLAYKLKKEKFLFKLNIVGTGKMENKLKKLIDKYDLNDYVVLIGSVPSSDVRKFMDNADIFLFTSDFNEGWGAVLNESMSSGCAVVASHAIGSVPFLIENGINGLIYKNENLNDLYTKVKSLFLDSNLREELSKNAYKTMIEEWNAEKACLNLIELYNCLIKDKKINLENGVCSVAPNVKQIDMYKFCTNIEGNINGKN